ncbi:enoyl-CoA hydratase/isomerase family protein [Oerskovia flava]|uniref:enoyl-CoA hydratase/isomerase family protein n=1 Tax=Oerskovia flava TaxID=2986422 RepID=UPI002240829E|nr:enoyl-CoA hydratase/isomerase family protein [Oerskovia sp. JB1-3-2]
MTSRILAHADGGLGHLTLDRPRALNALDHLTLDEVAGVLEAWRDDPAVAAVVLDGAGERGFCAGGDIRELYGSVTDGRHPDARRYFRREYALDAAIAEYPKPVVAIMDGITMGGGVGLSGHAAVRVVTERSRVAMPETRIGFTPDVGGSWLLARAPGHLGEHLALTGASMTGADAIHAGFADHLVPADRLPALVDELRRTGDVAEAVARYAVAPPEAPLAARRAHVDACYAAATVEEIVDRLHDAARRGDEQAAQEVATLEALSPTALTVTLAAVRRARDLPTLRRALEQEYGLVSWFIETQPDLPEGIRAQVIDKDRSPRWRPATLAELDPGVAHAALAYVPPEPLWG